MPLQNPWISDPNGSSGFLRIGASARGLLPHEVATSRRTRATTLDSGSLPRRTAIVMGKGKLAVKVATWFQDASDYELVAVVPNVPESTWTVSLKDWAVQHDVGAIES